MAELSAADVFAGLGGRPTGAFNPAGCRLGLGYISADGEPVHTVHFPGRRGVVEPVAYRYKPTATDADLAWARAGRFEPDDSFALLHCIRSGVAGLPSVGDVFAVRGHAVRLPGGPGSYLTWAPPDGAEERTPAEITGAVGQTFRRCIAAGAEPVMIVDSVNDACWALWLFGRPVPLVEERADAYRAQHRRLCATVGGIEVGDPLIALLPMPGATGLSRGEPRVRGDITYASLSDGDGETVPRFGASLKEFEAVIGRIASTPQSDA